MARNFVQPNDPSGLDHRTKADRKNTMGLSALGLQVMQAGTYVVQACYGNVVQTYERLQNF